MEFGKVNPARSDLLRMSTIITSFILMLTFSCFAQTSPDFKFKALLNSNIKKVQSSTDIIYNVAELHTKLLDTNFYNVDSFNKVGYLILSYTVKDGIAKDTLTYSYETDTQNNLIKRTYTDSTSSAIVVTTFKLDSLGKITEEITQQTGEKYDTTRNHITYTYDSSGTLQTLDAHTYKIIYRHNDKKLLIEEITCRSQDPSDTFDIRKYHYNAKGNKTVEIMYAGLTDVYKYDEHNNIINKNGLSTEYIYDIYGNWTRRIEQLPKETSFSGKEYPTQWYRLTIRNIEYY